MNKNNAEMALIPTILCGGAGSRLWPVSREQFPKPFIKLDDGESLLQKAFLRGTALINVHNVLTVTNRELIFKVEDDYKEVNHRVSDSLVNNYILEPFGRNTAPAIAAACLEVTKVHGDDAILLVLAADHLISDQQAFSGAVERACELAKRGKLVTFGINPTCPETGYGYIESDGEDVVCFVEKPSLEAAQEYVTSGRYQWNSGMFCFIAGAMLTEMAEHCPEILEATKNCIGQSRKLAGEKSSQLELAPEGFVAIRNDSIDYAVMEKTKNAAVVACDIGCWRALGDLTAPDEDNNRIQGEVITQDTTNCTIKSEGRVIGAVGLDNLIIVDTHDALLVVDKNQTQDVKKIYTKLKLQEHEAHKLHRTAHRPWGSYTVLEEGVNFKIKRLEVKPGACLSLQMHHHRSEHWVVVSGTAKVLNDDKEFVLGVNESTFIPAQHRHRLKNIGSKLLVLIEVQTGDYLGEDDIVRLQDIYGRVADNEDKELLGNNK
jgi:mannose-1-phosphate guanylyltransferase/mannose-6-phosphate isomerase